MKRLIVITAFGLLLLVNSHVGAGKLEKAAAVAHPTGGNFYCSPHASQ